jgi:hypothetical protein
MIAAITRRRFLSGGIAAAAALLIAGVAYRYRELSERDTEIVAAIAPVMLGIPSAGAATVRGVDIAIAGLPLEARAQLHQLFGLLRFPLSRIFIAGIRHPWHAAREAEIAEFLLSWRYSRFVQLRSAYDALHQLIMAAWYGGSASWPAIGYAGPPRDS